MKTLLKNVGAVVAGFLTVVVLSVVSDTILEKAGVFPPISTNGLFVPWMLMLAFAYRSIYTVAGGYMTAILASEKPQRLVMALGIIGTIFGVLGVIAGWNLSAHWYPIALAVTAYPLVWLGGWLQLKKR